MKILIVDDNANDRMLLSENLRHCGYEVISAVDGVEGLERARESRPDAILSDALMPRMDGFQFLRALRNNDDLRMIPFVFYTAAYAGHKEAELAFSYGAAAFLTKPMEPDALCETLGNILDKSVGREDKGLIKDTEYVEKYSQIVASKLEEKAGELERTLKLTIALVAKIVCERTYLTYKETSAQETGLYSLEQYWERNREYFIAQAKTYLDVKESLKEW